MTSFDELGQDARLALLALDRHNVLTIDQLAVAVRIQQFEQDAAIRGLEELERNGLCARHGHLWQLTTAGREMAAPMRDEDHPFLA